jgi:hypothetical protein
VFKFKLAVGNKYALFILPAFLMTPDILKFEASLQEANTNTKAITL